MDLVWNRIQIYTFTIILTDIPGSHKFMPSYILSLKCSSKLLLLLWGYGGSSVQRSAVLTGSRLEVYIITSSGIKICVNTHRVFIYESLGNSEDAQTLRGSGIINN